MIIAEAGVNHNGDMGRARDMVAAAAIAGADYVKFQSFRASDLVAAGTDTASYQARNTGVEDQAALLRDVELGIEDIESLAVCCTENGIGFLCTAFDADDIGRLVAAGMDRIKIASGELTNQPALIDAAKFNFPILLSTGMATLQEIEDAVKVLQDAGADDLTLLHCTSLYPAPVDKLNLRAIPAMAEHFDLPVGYSDHSLGDHIAVAAVALGASVIEKHFTLDRALPGPDHLASLEPDELGEMVRKAKETFMALGDGEKRPVEGEADIASLVRRSWHAVRDLEKGMTLTEADVVLKRPADGLPPRISLVGSKLSSDVKMDAPILADHLDSPL